MKYDVKERYLYKKHSARGFIFFILIVISISASLFILKTINTVTNFEKLNPVISSNETAQTMPENISKPVEGNTIRIDNLIYQNNQGLFVIEKKKIVQSGYTSKKLMPNEIIISGISDRYVADFVKNSTLLGVSLVKLFDKSIGNTMTKHYYIERVKITYVFPWSIQIKIKEKDVYCIVYDRARGMFFEVAKDGTVLALIKSSSFLNFPIISMTFSKPLAIAEKLKIDFDRLDFYQNDTILSEIIVENDGLYATFVNASYPIFFGAFVTKEKLDNFLIISTLYKERIAMVDLSYPEIGRIVRAVIDGGSSER